MREYRVLAVAALVSALSLGCGSQVSRDMGIGTADLAGTEWIAQDVPQVDYFAVHGDSAMNVILVGAAGTIVRWNGTAFVVEASGTSADLFGVYSVNPMLAYAVGAGGTTLRWDGAQWTAGMFAPNPDAGLPPMPALSGVWADTSQALAVGEMGTAVRYDGTSWSQVPVDSPDNLLSITKTGQTFAVGTLGTISVYDGTAFHRQALMGYSKTLTCAVADQGGYLAGLDGALFVYSGGWNLIPGLPPVFLRGVAAPAGGDVWVVGFDATVARVRGGGTDIFVYPNIPNRWVNGVWAAAADDVWVVGASGMVLRGPPPIDPPLGDGGTGGNDAS
jgi:hypothetical protein